MDSPYFMTEEEREELAIRFTYHAPIDGQPDRYEAMRAAGHDLAQHISVNCPSSRERSVALTKLDEVVMWAIAAIARREGS